MGQIDPNQVIATLLVLFVGIGLHEYAHCLLADAAGDPTPRYYGRVTLNLTKHFDPFGVMMILITTFTGFGIGWGKPAPMDPRKMRNPRWDFFIAVAAGPICNFLQAIVYALVFRGLIALQPGLLDSMFLRVLLIEGIIVNLSLMVFNLIPLGPLDGHWLLGQLLPEVPRLHWYQFNARVGTIALFGLIILSQLTGFSLLSSIILPPVSFLFRFLTGQTF